MGGKPGTNTPRDSELDGSEEPESEPPEVTHHLQLVERYREKFGRYQEKIKRNSEELSRTLIAAEIALRRREKLERDPDELLAEDATREAEFLANLGSGPVMFETTDGKWVVCSGEAIAEAFHQPPGGAELREPLLGRSTMRR